MEHLSKEELRSITGYKQPSAQKRWLKKKGFVIRSEDCYGTPIVYYKDVYGEKRNPESVSLQQKTKWQPPPIGG